MSRRRVALGIAANALDRVVLALIQIALVPILATHWGLERFGGWSLLWTVPGLFVLGDLGFANAATVRMVMEVSRGERAAARVTMHSASQVVLGACAAIVLSVAALALALPDAWLPAVAGTSALDLRVAIIALAAYSALVMSSGLIQGLFRCNGRFAVGVLYATGTAILETGLLVGVVLTGGGIAAGALAVLVGRVAGLALTWAGAAAMRSGLLPGFAAGSAAVRSELLGPALAAMAIPLGTALLLQGTVIALGWAAGAAAVPAFVAARTLSRIGLQGTQMLTHALMPEFGIATATGNRRGQVRMFVLVLSAALVLTVPFALVLGLAGPWIIRLWSNGQIAAPAALTAAIAVSALCGGIWNPVSNLILAMNRQADFAPAYCALAASGVGLTLLLAGSLAGTAPALALAVVDLAMLAVVLRFALRHWAAKEEWLAHARSMAGEGRDLLARTLRR